MENQNRGVRLINNVGSKARKADIYAPAFGFWLPDNQRAYHSYGGLLMTVLLLVFLVFYGIMQAVKLFEYDETDVMISSRDAFFTSDFVYSKDLMYAFGITAYDNNREPIEDATYGILKPYYKSWGLKGTRDGIDWEPLPTRDCTESELHING